jgi:hypothetical protein
MRILEGRRRRVEERREGLRSAVTRAADRLDQYTAELHQLGLEASDREVRWLNELIDQERTSREKSAGGSGPSPPGAPPRPARRAKPIPPNSDP